MQAFTTAGVMEKGLLSPLLSNLVLSELDRLIRNPSRLRGPWWEFGEHLFHCLFKLLGISLRLI
jgi:retron-type reverse transcriptase